VLSTEAKQKQINILLQKDHPWAKSVRKIFSQFLEETNYLEIHNKQLNLLLQNLIGVLRRVAIIFSYQQMKFLMVMC